MQTLNVCVCWCVFVSVRLYIKLCVVYIVLWMMLRPTDDLEVRHAWTNKRKDHGIGNWQPAEW